VARYREGMDWETIVTAVVGGLLFALGDVLAARQRIAPYLRLPVREWWYRPRPVKR
jgi:hypothetical protein